MAVWLARTSRHFAFTLTILLLVVGAAAAEKPFTLQGTPGKLPKAVVPIHYAIELVPNLARDKFAGSVVVDIVVSKRRLGCGCGLAAAGRGSTSGGTTVAVRADGGDV
jgi:hypothetical protein